MPWAVGVGAAVGRTVFPLVCEVFQSNKFQGTVVGAGMTLITGAAGHLGFFTSALIHTIKEDNKISQPQAMVETDRFNIRSGKSF
jgi:hypothetical protein